MVLKCYELLGYEICLGYVRRVSNTCRSSISQVFKYPSIRKVSDASTSPSWKYLCYQTMRFQSFGMFFVSLWLLFVHVELSEITYNFFSIFLLLCLWSSVQLPIACTDLGFMTNKVGFRTMNSFRILLLCP